jgi:hypothetical protein
MHLHLENNMLLPNRALLLSVWSKLSLGGKHLFYLYRRSAEFTFSLQTQKLGELPYSTFKTI